MPKDDFYYLEQTPEALCKELMKHIPDLHKTDTFFEPFAGEGAWIKAFPEEANIIQTELEHGTDYKSINLDEALVDWVITNPPYQIDNDTATKKENAFINLANYFAGKTNKGFAFLLNEKCFSALTPPRLKILYQEKGIYIHKIVVCSVKKWRGRYFFIIFKNRCCLACKRKKTACCPKLTDEERAKIEAEMEEHEKEEKEALLNQKQRFDFFDFVEGVF
jgi:site-specific DNA-adenine methylase